MTATGLILAWRVAGYFGIDRYLLPAPGASWRPGPLFNRGVQHGGSGTLPEPTSEPPARVDPRSRVLSMKPRRPFTETPQFKVMRVVVGSANPLVRRLLGSRFAGPLGARVMLLRFRGRASGQWHTTPVGYAREGHRVAAVTSPAYRWWRNVVEPAAVQVRLDGRWYEAVARLVPPDDPIYDKLVALQVRQRGPQMLRTFGVEVSDDGRVPPEVRAEASDHAHLVLIELGDPIDRPG